MTLAELLDASRAIAGVASAVLPSPARDVARVITGALTVAHTMATDGRSADEIVTHITRIRPLKRREIDARIDEKLSSKR